VVGGGLVGGGGGLGLRGVEGGWVGMFGGGGLVVGGVLGGLVGVSVAALRILVSGITKAGRYLPMSSRLGCPLEQAPGKITKSFYGRELAHGGVRR